MMRCAVGACVAVGCAVGANVALGPGVALGGALGLELGRGDGDGVGRDEGLPVVADAARWQHASTTRSRRII